MTTTLITTEERSRLVELEMVVEQNLGSVFKVRQALEEIRDKELHRETHKTFAEYVEDRFAKSASHIYRLIAHVRVQESLEEHCPEDAKLITNERQARVLAKLKPEEAKEVLEMAKETSAVPGKVTAQHLEKTAKIIQARKAEPVAEPGVSDPDAFLATAVENCKSQIGSLESALRSARQLASDAADGIRGLEIFGSKKGSIVRALDEVLAAVRSCKPKRVCDKCYGKKCSKCGLRGWEAK